MFEELFTETQPSFLQTRICSPFKLFYASFDKTHPPCHASEKLTIETFNQVFLTFHTYHFDSLSLFITVFSAKQINTSSSKLINLLFNYQFLKTSLTLNIESRWIQKDLFHLLFKITNNCKNWRW